MKLATEIVLTFALNALWQVAAIGIFAGVAAWLLRDAGARYRHAVWAAALVLSLIVPALSSVRVFSVDRGSQQQSESTPAPVAKTGTYSSAVEFVEPDETQLLQETTKVKQPAQGVFSSPVRLNGDLANGLMTLYALLILYRLVKLSRAWIKTRAIVQGAWEFEPSASLRSVISRCEDAIGVKGIRILASKRVAIPVTAGVVKPVVIVPRHLLTETDQNVLISAIGHELVHVARRDYLLNLVYELVYLPVSFHTAAAIIRRGIKRTRELCCDERVTERLINAQSYAQSIVRLVGSTPASGRLATDTTIGIAESDNLEARIMTLMKGKKTTARRRPILLLAACTLLIAPCIAAARLTLAFDVQEPSATTQKPKAKTAQVNERRKRDELERAARTLQEKIRVADEAQRAPLEQKLREVEQALEDQARLTEKVTFELQSERDAEIRKLRETLMQLEKSQPRDEAQVNKMRAMLAEMERQRAEQLAELGKYTLLEQQYSAELEKKLYTQREAEQQYKELLDKYHASKELELMKQYEQKLKEQEPAAGAGSGSGQGSGQGSGSQSDVREMRRRKDQEGGAQDDRARRQAELAQSAVITMDRAIQIATSKYPGKVLACSLGRDKDGPVFYHVVVVNVEDGKLTTKYVWISAIDGTILKSEDERKPAAISGGVLNGKAISLPIPAYPQIAKAARASGTVMVEIMADEQGDVISARALSGHPLLQGAAVEAARQAKLAPTRLEGQPIKVRGMLVYNFVAQ